MPIFLFVFIHSFIHYLSSEWFVTSCFHDTSIFVVLYVCACLHVSVCLCMPSCPVCLYVLHVLYVCLVLLLLFWLWFLLLVVVVVVFHSLLVFILFSFIFLDAFLYSNETVIASVWIWMHRKLQRIWDVLMGAKSVHIV